MCFVLSILQVVENTMTPPMGKWDPSSHLPDPRVQEPIEERYPEIRIETARNPRVTDGSGPNFLLAKKNMTKNKTGPPVNSANLSGKLLENLYDFPRVYSNNFEATTWKISKFIP